MEKSGNDYGMTRLEIKSDHVGELRRMCLLPSLQKNPGWGIKMVQLKQQGARDMNFQQVTATAPEYVEDVLRYYSQFASLALPHVALQHQKKTQETTT